uniref:Uncharacterized protein n=1 Tax=Sphaerodactylus townsendi TaxID=933632 RepID=A0ACB8F4X1_9SAUR
MQHRCNLPGFKESIYSNYESKRLGTPNLDNLIPFLQFSRCKVLRTNSSWTIQECRRKAKSDISYFTVYNITKLSHLLRTQKAFPSFVEGKKSIWSHRVTQSQMHRTQQMSTMMSAGKIITHLYTAAL